MSKKLKTPKKHESHFYLIPISESQLEFWKNEGTQKISAERNSKSSHLSHGKKNVTEHQHQHRVA